MRSFIEYKSEHLSKSLDEHLNKSKVFILKSKVFIQTSLKVLTFKIKVRTSSNLKES